MPELFPLDKLLIKAQNMARGGMELCLATCHYIRVSVVESLVLETIRRVSGYVRENEADFIERVVLLC